MKKLFFLFSTLPMVRLFINQPLFHQDQTLGLAPPQAHYLIHVMRLQPADKILVFNGQDGLWQATLSMATKHTPVLLVNHQVAPQPPAPPSLKLAFGLIKRQDWLVEKATELGATDLIPLISHHTSVRISFSQRLEKIIMESCEQSQRLHIPQLYPAVKLSQWLKAVTSESPKEFIMVLDPDYPGVPLASWSFCSTVVIGPEGGWSSSEKQSFQAHPQVILTGLPTPILRAETAALASLTLLGYARI